MSRFRRSGPAVAMALLLAGCSRAKDSGPAAAPAPDGAGPGAAAVVVSPRATLDPGFPSQAAGRDTNLFGLSVSADGRRVVLCADEGGGVPNAQVWELDGPKKVDEFGSWHAAVALTPDGRAVVYQRPYDVLVVRPVGGGKERALETSKGSGSWCRSPAGDRVAVAVAPDLQVWDLASGSLVLTQKPFAGEPVPALSNFFDDGRKVATGTETGEITVWEVSTGKGSRAAVLQPGKPENWYFSLPLAVTPDGTYVATRQGLGGSLYVRQLATGGVMHEIGRESLAPGMPPAIFLPDGHTLAVAKRDNSVELVDVGSGRTRASLRGHTRPVTSVAAARDGKTLVSADSSGAVKVWDLP